MDTPTTQMVPAPDMVRFCGKKEALLNLGVYGEGNANIPGFSFGTAEKPVSILVILQVLSPIPKVETMGHLLRYLIPNEPSGRAVNVEQVSSLECTCKVRPTPLKRLLLGLLVLQP